MSDERTLAHRAANTSILCNERYFTSFAFEQLAEYFARKKKEWVNGCISSDEFFHAIDKRITSQYEGAEKRLEVALGEAFAIDDD